MEGGREGGAKGVRRASVVQKINQQSMRRDTFANYLNTTRPKAKLLIAATHNIEDPIISRSEIFQIFQSEPSPSLHTNQFGNEAVS